MNTPIEQLRKTYDVTAAQYRRDDVTHVTSEDHLQICAVLKEICESFPQKIDVLSLGCGTLRDAHCLSNVSQFVGIDVSQKMLDQAEHPVNEELCPKERFLFRWDFHSESLSFPFSFDFIYAISTFGHGCMLSPALCSKIKQWLTPNGVFFFDVADAETLPWFTKIRKTIRKWIYHKLPTASQTYWDKLSGSVPMWLTSEAELRMLLEIAGFKNVEIARRFCQMPCGKGYKLQVKATA